MDLKPNYIIDTLNEVSRLELYIDGVKVTTFLYDKGYVHLDEFNTSEVDPVIFAENLNIVIEWIRLINKLLPSHNSQKEDYSLRESTSSTDIIYRFKVLDKKFTKHTYKVSEGIIKIDKRDAIVLSYPLFVFWINFLKSFINEVQHRSV